MAGAARRGKLLLQSSVAFAPVPPQTIQFRTCFWSAFSGFLAAAVVFIAWILSQDI